MRRSIFVVLLLVGAKAQGDEVVQLLDNTKVAGHLLHYYDGILVIEAGGQEMRLPRDKVKSVTFKLPPARPELASPEKTFERWRKAMEKSDMETALDCYALMYQGMLAQQLSQAGEEEFKKTQKEISSTKFQIKGSKVDGDGAVLKVVRQKGEDIETADIRFVKENGEWKLTPFQ
jgi:hypothetical protein